MTQNNIKNKIMKCFENKTKQTFIYFDKIFYLAHDVYCVNVIIKHIRQFIRR